MKKVPYKVERHRITEYRFTSEGPKGEITKIVQIEPLAGENLYNIGFGDLTSEGHVDDKVESNNEDIVKVLATVIHIIQDFLAEKPEAKLFFTGSTTQRTEVYRLILVRYYPELSKTYSITALKKESREVIEVEFKATDKGPFLGFLIEKYY